MLDRTLLVASKLILKTSRQAETAGRVRLSLFHTLAAAGPSGFLRSSTQMYEIRFRTQPRKHIQYTEKGNGGIPYCFMMATAFGCLPTKTLNASSSMSIFPTIL